MSELIKELRNNDCDGYYSAGYCTELCEKAADEIGCLQARVEKLKQAIKDYLTCHADPPTADMARAKLQQILEQDDD